MSQNPDSLRSLNTNTYPTPLLMTLPPMALVSGVLLAFYYPSIKMLAAFIHPIVICLGIGTLILAKPRQENTLRSGSLGIISATLLSLIVGWSISCDYLQDRLKSFPPEQALDKSYQIQGNFVQGWSGTYGDGLLLQDIQIISPKNTPFELERLVIYVPEIETFPQRGSQVTAWITLKKKFDSHPIPWPVQGLRELYIPSYRGSVKSSRLWSFQVAAQKRDNQLNPGNRQLVALILDGMPSPIWRDRLNPFGLGHLLAISGLHCIFVFMGLQLLLFPIRRPFPRAMATSFGLLLFAHWVGWTPSVTRAACMLIGWQLLPSFHRHRSWLRLWFGLLIIGILADPALLLMRGFWYSFAASLGLVLGGRLIRPMKDSPLQHPLLSRLRPFLPIVAAQSFVIPINLMFDGYTRFTSLFWNLFGVCFLIVLGILLCLALIASKLPFLIPLANSMETWIGKALAMPQWEAIQIEAVRFPQAPAVVLVCLLVMALFLRFCPREWRWYGVFLSLTAFLYLGQPHKGEQLTVLDVGQGQCILHVDEMGEAILYDAGGRLPQGLRLDRLIKLHGGKHIKKAFISHYNKDHYELLEPLPRDFPLIVPPGQLKAFKESSTLHGFQMTATQKGDRDHWGTASVEVIWPSYPESNEQKPTPSYPNENEESIVLIYQGKDCWILLTGDAGLWTEQQLELPNTSGIPVLQVGHHGSRSSTGNVLLDQIKPRVAIISSGQNNRFNHPHPSVLERLHQRGINILNTAESGTICITLKGYLKQEIIQENTNTQ